MLFSEVYGAYYECVREMIDQAQQGRLTDVSMREIVREQAFPESMTEIPQALKTGKWPLLRKDGSTVIRHPADVPLTKLQKQWLKSLLNDPRIRLFDVSEAGLEDVEPLFTYDQIVWYDRFTDGDPWEDEEYQKRFRTICGAIRLRRGLKSIYRTHRDHTTVQEIYPKSLEYSPQDDKFRLLGYRPRDGRNTILNLKRMISCEMTDSFDPAVFEGAAEESKQAVVELINERNALERLMFQFSNLAKKTEQVDSRRYRVTLSYRPEDETEMLIKLMSFGPVLKVLEPAELVNQLKERIQRQIQFENKIQNQ